jgi:hypothetical protein
MQDKTPVSSRKNLRADGAGTNPRRRSGRKVQTKNKQKEKPEMNQDMKAYIQRIRDMQQQAKEGDKRRRPERIQLSKPRRVRVVPKHSINRYPKNAIVLVKRTQTLS